MARIKTKKLSWDASPDVDVKYYNIYVVPEGETLSYDSNYVSVPASQLSYDLPGTFNMTDGVYQIGITAEDSMGNESDMTVGSFPFDFTAPAPVTNIRIVTV